MRLKPEGFSSIRGGCDSWGVVTTIYLPAPIRYLENKADRVARAILVADDVIGGFFAINQGAFGADEDMYYWAPDRLQWEPIGFDFSFFFRWSLTGALADFYQHYRCGLVGSKTPLIACPRTIALLSIHRSGAGKAVSREGWSNTIPIEDMFALKSAAQQAEG